MEKRAKQGLILGFIIGVFMFAGFYLVSDHNLLCVILIPICTIMGWAPQLLKPVDEEED